MLLETFRLNEGSHVHVGNAPRAAAPQNGSRLHAELGSALPLLYVMDGQLRMDRWSAFWLSPETRKTCPLDAGSPEHACSVAAGSRHAST